MTQHNQSWSFLVSKNRYLEYRTVVAPDFLCKAKIAGLLARAAGGDVTKSGQAIYTQILNSELGDLTLVFRVIESSYEAIGMEGDGIIKDSFGREIRLIEGVVFEGNLPVTDINLGEDNFEELHQELREHYRNFWTWEQTQPPIPSESCPFEIKGEGFKIIPKKAFLVNPKPFSSTTLSRLSCYKTKEFRSEIISVIFCSNDRSLIIRCDEQKRQTVWIWTILNKEKISLLSGEVIPMFGHFTPAVISPSGGYVATAMIATRDTNIIKVVDINTNKELCSFDISGGSGNRVNALTFINNEILISGGGNGILYFWGIPNFKYQNFLSNSGVIKAISYNSNSLLASGHSKGTIIIWDLNDSKTSATVKHTFNNAHGTPNESPVNALAFSPDGKTLASAGDDCKIKLWDAINCQPICTLGEHSGTISTIVFHPQSKFLASGDDQGWIKIWEISSQKSLVVVREHQSAVTSLCFSPDGKILASGSKDKTIRLWELT